MSKNPKEESDEIEKPKHKKEKKNQEIKTSKKNKVKKRIIWCIVIIAIVVELGYGVYLLYEKFKKKFKSIDIEIGSVTELKMKDFLIDEKYKENSIMITDLTNIDFKKVGEYKVKLSNSDREEEVILRLVDTTPPKVEFQDLTKYIDYKPTPHWHPVRTLANIPRQS